MINRRDVIISGAAVAGLMTTGIAWGADTTISVADSPLPQALDLYYDFLLKVVVDAGPPSKLLLNNTITSFDIASDTPFYNEGLFANFADRVFRTSPQQIGPANKADRMSLHYERLINEATSQIDQNHPGMVTQIGNLQKQITSEQNKLTATRISIDRDWAKLVAQESLKPEDPNYQLKYINYLESVRYADQIRVSSQNIDSLIGQIDTLRRSYYTVSQQLLLDVLYELTSTKKIARPLSPRFERTIKGVNDITFADPTVRVEAICDISPSTLPAGDLVKFLTDAGARGFSISKSETAVHHHDHDWNASGEANFPIFGIPVGIGGGGSGSSGYTNAMKVTNTIGIGFENIDEVLVNRGRWFDPSIFDDKANLKLLSKLPEFKSMQDVSISVVIGRGSKITLSFDTAVDASSWSKTSISGHGGISVLGFGFGARGGETTNDWNVDVSADQRTVTFTDAPTLARVLAYRVEPIVGASETRKVGVRALM